MRARPSAVHVRIKSVRLDSANGSPEQFAAQLQGALRAQFSGRSPAEVQDVAGEIAAQVATHLDQLREGREGRLL